MNVFISGSSSILAAALIQSHFDRGDTLYICDDISAGEDHIVKELEKRTGGRPMDRILLLHGEELLNAAPNRTSLRSKTEQNIAYTNTLCRYFAALSVQPQTLLLLSSALIYQNLDGEKSVENSPLGREFPADYFNQLEQATKPAQESGIRTLHLRLGKIISKKTEPSIPWLFLAGQPVILPHGKISAISWVSLEDTMRAISFLIDNKSVSGPINISSGDIVPRGEFLKLIRKKYKNNRPILLPRPFIRLWAGIRALQLQESSTQAIPLKLMQSGFLFENISLQEYFAQEEQGSNNVIRTA